MRHYLTAMLICILTVSAEAHTYQLVLPQGVGSCTCIGHTRRGSLFVTARHNFRESKTAAVVDTSGKPHSVSWIGKHPSADVAVFEVDGWQADHLPLCTEPVAGEVQYGGYPLGGDFRVLRGVVESDTTIRNRGSHVIPGDSGAGVFKQVDGRWCVVGVVNGYVTSGQRETVYTDATVIAECLAQWYSPPRCIGGQCDIMIRPQIQQPIFGIPTGPPRIVNVAEPVIRPAPPTSLSTGPQGPPGERGPQGLQGPPGRDGRSVTKGEVEAAVYAWLDANRESLQEAARQDISQLDARIRALELAPVADTSALQDRVRRLEDRRIQVMVVDGTNVLDAESYGGGDPIVLDVRKIRGQN